MWRMRALPSTPIPAWVPRRRLAAASITSPSTALGVGQLLGLAQGLVEGRALLGHAGEDEVRRAVDDAQDALHAVAGQRLAQRANEGNATGDRRFEQEVDARLLGGLEQLTTDVGQ